MTSPSYDFEKRFKSKQRSVSTNGARREGWRKGEKSISGKKRESEREDGGKERFNDWERIGEGGGKWDSDGQIEGFVGTHIDVAREG